MMVRSHSFFTTVFPTLLKSSVLQVRYLSSALGIWITLQLKLTNPITRIIRIL